jgi:hypothetical protein
VSESNPEPDLIFAKIHPAIYSTVCYVKVGSKLVKVLAVLDTGSSSTIVDAGFAQHYNSRYLVTLTPRNAHTWIDL